MTIPVRPCGLNDCADLARLHAACFEKPWSAEDIHTLIQVPVTQGFMGREKAFGLIRVVADEAEILTIGVIPGARGQGIGRALLKSMLDWAKAQGAAAVFLEVAEDNARAVALYNAQGFTVMSRRRGYYSRPEGTCGDALVLRLPL